jgi:hypothetical protein
MAHILYQVSFDTNLKQFDHQYPITLAPYSVTPQEFLYTIENCSVFLGGAYDEIYSLNKRNFIYLFACLTALLTIVLAPIFFITRLEWWQLLSIIGLGMLSIGAIMIYICTIWIKKIKEIQSRAKRNVLNFLQHENEIRYYSRGIQFIIRMDANNFGDSDSFSNYPIIEILASHPYNIPRYDPSVSSHSQMHCTVNTPSNSAEKRNDMAARYIPANLLINPSKGTPGTSTRLLPPPPPLSTSSASTTPYYTEQLYPNRH